jgi:hypothetical protein
MENITTENKPQVGGMQVFKKSTEEKAEIKKMKALYKKEQIKNKKSLQN